MPGIQEAPPLVRRVDVQRHRRHAAATRHAAGRIRVHRSGRHRGTHAAGRAPRQSRWARFRSRPRLGERRRSAHPQRLRHRRHRDGADRHVARSGTDDGRATAGAIPARDQAGVAARPRRSRHRQLRVRRQQFHARNHRLRAGRARRLGEDEGACEHRVRRGSARRERSPHFATPSELDDAESRRSDRMQRLPHAHQRIAARPSRCGSAVGESRCAERRFAVPEYRSDAVRERRRNDGRNLHAHPRRAEAERRHQVRRRVDRSERARERCELRVCVRRADDQSAGRSRLRHELDRELPHHRELRNVDTSVVERASARRRRRDQRDVQQLSLAGRRDGCRAGTGGATRSVGRRVAGRGQAIQQLSRIAVFGQSAGSGERRIGRPPGSGYRCERKSPVSDGRKRQPDPGRQRSTDSGARQRDDVRADVGRRRAGESAFLLALQRRWNARGLAHAGGIEADLGMAGHWCTVFQRPVCGASGLTTHLRRGLRSFEQPRRGQGQ